MGGAERPYHVFRQGDKPGIFILMVRPSWTHCMCVWGGGGGGGGGGWRGEGGGWRGRGRGGEGSRRWYNVCSLSTYMYIVCV